MNFDNDELDAQFDAKLKIYWYLQTHLVLLCSIIGIPLMPVWFFIGAGITSRQFNALSCKLTRDKLIVKRGVWFRTQKTIPLENIQDLSVSEGPILSAFGLCSLRVETAGQGVQPGQADAALAGIIGALNFRDEVFNRRDALRAGRGASPFGAQQLATEAVSDNRQTLTEIRDVLLRIEANLKREKQ